MQFSKSRMTGGTGRYLGGRRVGIIGGGPGGLMTAYCLQKHATVPYKVTILEASPRVGGKILTSRFSAANVTYEAGAAEIYDYSLVGPDPLRELILELGLSITPMDGHRVIMEPQGGPEEHSARPPEWDLPSLQCLDRFDQQARECIGPRQFYRDDWIEGDPDPVARTRFDTLLADIPDPRVRHYIRTMVHSDLATEPERTNGTYGLQNYLMNDPAYMRLYSIEGGIESLPRALAGRLEAEILLEQAVVGIEKSPTGSYRVRSRYQDRLVEHEFDFVVAALPNHLLPGIDWGRPILADAIRRHHAHYDYPAHYLRVTILFERPFWRDILRESFFMLDAFDGCCVYDESSRNGTTAHGVLGWLLGGAAAESMSQQTDDELIRAMLDSLPANLSQGQELMIEGHVHRWIRGVNGMPSGYPRRHLYDRHVPEPSQHPGLFLVGDYLFDSTLNGVLDSADYVAELLAAELGQRCPIRKELRREAKIR